MAYVLYAGVARRSNRRAAVAGAVVVGESLIFVGNGLRCPLTQLAERIGAEKGSVTDTYLPDWFARNLPALHVPLIVLAVLLHARNLRGRPLFLLATRHRRCTRPASRRPPAGTLEL